MGLIRVLAYTDMLTHVELPTKLPISLVSSLATVENRRLGGESQPVPISSVPLPLWWPDRRWRGWGTRSEVVGV